MQFGAEVKLLCNLRILLVFRFHLCAPPTPEVFHVSQYKYLDMKFADVAYDPLAFFPEIRGNPASDRPLQTRGRVVCKMHSTCWQLVPNPQRGVGE